MPRVARVKSFDSIFHIMVKSIIEAQLFKDDKDKIEYLFRVKKYQDRYHFKVYAYCLMDNHAHFIIDANGADISKIMHGINQSYTYYYNKTYNRIGHLFHDRFKSKIVTDERYLITLSGYIHNNPSAIKEVKDNIAKYRFSSLKVYIGLSNDEFEILDEDFIMSFFSNNPYIAREKYFEFVRTCKNPNIKAEVNFETEKTEYRSERHIIIRDKKPEDIINFVTGYFNIDNSILNMKYNRNSTKIKAICVLLLSSFCNLSQKEICKYVGNITQSRISELIDLGLLLIKNEYSSLIMDFLSSFSIAA